MAAHAIGNEKETSFQIECEAILVVGTGAPHIGESSRFNSEAQYNRTSRESGSLAPTDLVESELNLGVVATEGEGILEVPLRSRGHSSL